MIPSFQHHFKKQDNAPIAEVLERITDAFVALDNNWCYTYMNRKAGELTGRNPEKMIGKNIWAELPYSGGQPFQKAYEKAMATQKYVYLEEYYQPFDRWFENHIYPSPEGLSIFFRDITEKKKNELALELSNRHLEEAEELTHTGYFYFNLSTGVATWSKGLCRIYGIQPEEFEGTYDGFIKRVHPGDRDAMNKVRENLTEPGPQDFFEIRIIRPEGSIRHVKSAFKLIKDAAGIPVAFMGTVIDITESKKAELLLKESEERYRKLIEQAIDGIIVADKNGKILLANRSMCRMLGYTMDEILSRYITDTYPEAEKENEPERRKKIVESDTMRFERFMLKKDGTVFPIEATIGKTAEGNFQAIVRDITDRKKAESELVKAKSEIEESEAKFSAITNQATEGIVLSDMNGNYKFVNPGFCTMTGYTENELLHMKVFDLRGKTQAPGSFNEAKTSKEGLPIEVTLRRKDDSEFTTEIIGRNIKIGTEEFVLGTVRDITGRKKAEQIIKESEERYRDLVENISDLVCTHDLDGNIISVNKAALKISGYEFGPDKHLNVKDILAPGRNNNYEDYIADILKNGRAHGIMKVKTRQGEIRLWEFDNTIKITGENTPPVILGYARDITEQKKAEKAIRAEKEFADEIINSLPGIFYMSDQTPKLLKWNKSLETVSGYSSEELRVIRPRNLFDPQDHSVLLQAIEKTFKEGFADVEIRLLTKNGEIIPYYFTGVCIEYEGKPVMLGTGIDITKRKKAEERIKESEERYRSLFENSNEAILLTKTDGTTLSANPAACKMFGRSEEEICKLGRNGLVNLEDPRLGSALKERKRTGKMNGELTFIRKDGTIFPAEISSTVFTTVNGEERTSMIIHDLSEKKKAEEQLIKSEELFSGAFHASPAGIIITRIADGKIINANETLLKMFEFSREEMIGHTSIELKMITKDERTKLIQQQLKSGGVVNYELLFHTKSGKPINLLFSSKQLTINDELCHITSMIDNTERKKAEEEIKSNNEKLRQLTAHLHSVREEERKRISREIHDELGQQLTAVKMDVAWIDKKIPEESVNLKTKLKNAIQLLDKSNLSIRKILNELRTGVLEYQNLEHAMEWQGKQFTANTGIPVSLHYQIREHIDEATAVCLFRVYQEALTNITRHAKAKKVNASLARKGNTISLSIEDDGKGFDMNAVKDKKSFGILGMKERVYSLLGTFELDSAKGKGTKISIRLPYKG